MLSLLLPFLVMLLSVPIVTATRLLHCYLLLLAPLIIAGISVRKCVSSLRTLHTGASLQRWPRGVVGGNERFAEASGN